MKTSSILTSSDGQSCRNCDTGDSDREPGGVPTELTGEYGGSCCVGPSCCRAAIILAVRRSSSG